MDDPFSSWYAKQLPAGGKGGPVPNTWDFFTLSHDDSSSTNIEEEHISVDNINQWAGQISHSPSPGVDVLFARHKNCTAQIRYLCQPLESTQFETIFKKLSLPAQYFYLRGMAGVHCNAYTCQAHRDIKGKVSHVSVIIRIGFAKSKRCGMTWSVALTWNVQTNRTVGFIEGFSATDMSELKFHIKSCSRNLSHPLMIPEILLHMITVKLNDQDRVPCEDDFYAEEQRTGISNMPNPINHASVWAWNLQDFKDVTTKANRCLTNMVFLERRFRFTTELTRRFVSLLAELRNDEQVRKIVYEDHLRQRLLNRMWQLEAYVHQTECVQKRMDNLNTVLYTALSQIDSKNQSKLARINLQIAQAVRSETIPMRTIAYVTLAFLPGALIAAIFGMNFFQFDASTKELVIAKTFWHYWAVTIPVTLVVIACWNVWNYHEKRKGPDDSKVVSILDEKLDVNELDMDARNV